MIIGCPKEIKNQEYRSGITPAAAHEAVANGHDVIMQKGAGAGAGFPDEEYVAVGARIVDTAEEIFATAELVVKVKEPQPAERAQLRKDQILFTYLHLAPDAEQTADLMASGVTAIAYETVTDKMGGLPLLAPIWQLDTTKSQRRARHPYGRRPGCCTGKSYRHRRRRCWNTRSENRGGHGRGRDRAGYVDCTYALPR